MEERKLQIGKVQVILRHSSPVLKAVVIVLIVFSMAALGALMWVQAGLQSQVRSMTAEAAAILDENEKLSRRLETPGDVKTIREIAEEELDLVTPDTVLIELQ
ncbi:MAG: hypothetical protein MR883_05970 [Clostridiales bacterium]|nr:hypothetical protein [Clostridiales bacterium]MCI7573725.1 hypothetical protein [Clostridiales bacterium]